MAEWMYQVVTSECVTRTHHYTPPLDTTKWIDVNGSRTRPQMGAVCTSPTEANFIAIIAYTVRVCLTHIWLKFHSLPLSCPSCVVGIMLLGIQPRQIQKQLGSCSFRWRNPSGWIPILFFFSLANFHRIGTCECFIHSLQFKPQAKWHCGLTMDNAVCLELNCLQIK